jgi:CheY-like chemotaxis protein
MPDMDGFRMIRSLKNRQETKRIQIVVVTILNSEEIKEQGGLPSDVLVLHKPIPFNVIKELVMGRTATATAVQKGY